MSRGGLSRDHRLIAVFASLAVLATGLSGAGVVLAEPSPVQAVSRDVPTGPDGRVRVQFLGDTLVGDEVQLLIDQRAEGYDWPFDGIRDALTGDYVIANAEGPIGDRTQPWNPAKDFSYSSRPEVAGALARAGVDAVTLANNYAYDTRPQGLADTMRLLDEVGIPSVGAGPDLVRAEQPLLLRTEFGTLGVMSIGESFGHRATEAEGGTLVLSPEAVRRGHALARAAGADWVVAAVHWGGNYARIDGAQREFAEAFAAAGYDLVIGHGPHSTQPIEYVGSTPVIYSIGNFVFGTPGRWATNGVPGLGLSVELELSAASTPTLSVRCLVTDNIVVGYQPRLCDPAEARGFLPTLATDLELRGDVGALPCPGCFVREPVR